MLAKSMIVDVHAHYYPSHYIERLKAPGSPFELRHDPTTGRDSFYERGGLVLGYPAEMRELEERIAGMDALGIQTQILSLAGPNVTFLTGQASLELAQSTNDALIEVSRQAPGRFLVLASIPASDPDLAIAELNRVAPNAEVVGVCVLSNIAGNRLDHPRFEPIWEEVDRLGLMVLVHPTTPLEDDIRGRGDVALAVGFPQETASTIAALFFARMFDRYPSVRWVFCHLGGGIHAYWDRFVKTGMRAGLWQEPDMSFSEASRRVYFDCVSGHLPSARCTYDTVGASQMLYGTDCPHIPFDQSLNNLRALALPDADEQAILSGNILGILGEKTSESIIPSRRV